LVSPNIRVKKCFLKLNEKNRKFVGQAVKGSKLKYKTEDIAQATC
jgi:hypothetical protein